MSAKLIPSVIVVIKDDPALVTAFLDWALENRIYSLREGGGYTGQGRHVASYAPEHSARITKFLRANKSKRVKTNG